jgi:phosphotransferase system enzyme I (PtsI)
MQSKEKKSHEVTAKPTSKISVRRRALKGLSVSPGIAIGTVQKINFGVDQYPKYWITEKETRSEARRFRKATQDCHQHLLKLQQDLCKFQVGEKAQILDSYQMIIKDQALRNATIAILEQELINVEWAFMKAVDQVRKAFSKTDIPHFLERQTDLDHIAHHILKHLSDIEHETIPQFKKGSIIVARDLSPADTAQMSRSTVSGFITAAGGTTSHTAIMARALEIPAVVGIEDIEKLTENGTPIIIDGTEGIVVIHPRASDLTKYRTIKKKYEHMERQLLKDVHQPAITQDGFELHMSANVELMDEISIIKTRGAEAIGLYRTEILFLRKKQIPSEDEQYEHYRKLLSRMKPLPVTIRTLDIGGEKILPEPFHSETVNPALGLRAIRLCLRDREMFSAQLRALLRASCYGNLRILVPMISTLEEVRAVQKLIADISQELKDKKMRVARNIQFGAMIETPASALLADAIATEVDFLSIGTNDLIQYCLAVDRSNEQVANLYDPFHPSIIRLLKYVVDAARNRNIEVSVCGEIAGDPSFFPVLLGLGVTELSMNPLSIPLVKRHVRQLAFKECNQAVEDALRCKTADEVRQIIRKISSNLKKL